ncbi:hypothetical protein HDU93_002004 [Gonapodya sp. JEL0774]|nr:hypothetical protein HDU93_002004 [Gonapodya sp. JEL0774]
MDTPIDTPRDAQLIEAVENGQTELVCQLLADGADAKARKKVTLSCIIGPDLKTDTVEGESALTLAILHHHLDIAEVLIRHGADPNEPCVAWPVANYYSSWDSDKWKRERWWATFSFPSLVTLAVTRGGTWTQWDGFREDRPNIYNALAINHKGGNVQLTDPQTNDDAFVNFTLRPSLPIVQLLLRHGAVISDTELAAARKLTDTRCLRALEQHQAQHPTPIQVQPPLSAPVPPSSWPSSQSTQSVRHLLADKDREIQALHAEVWQLKARIEELSVRTVVAESKAGDLERRLSEFAAENATLRATCQGIIVNLEIRDGWGSLSAEGFDQSTTSGHPLSIHDFATLFCLIYCHAAAQLHLPPPSLSTHCFTRPTKPATVTHFALQPLPIMYRTDVAGPPKWATYYPTFHKPHSTMVGHMASEGCAGRERGRRMDFLVAVLVWWTQRVGFGVVVSAVWGLGGRTSSTAQAKTLLFTRAPIYHFELMTLKRSRSPSPPAAFLQNSYSGDSFDFQAADSLPELTPGSGDGPQITWTKAEDSHLETVLLDASSTCNKLSLAPFNIFQRPLPLGLAKILAREAAATWMVSAVDLSAIPTATAASVESQTGKTNTKYESKRNQANQGGPGPLTVVIITSNLDQIAPFDVTPSVIHPPCSEGSITTSLSPCFPTSPTRNHSSRARTWVHTPNSTRDRLLALARLIRVRFAREKVQRTIKLMRVEYANDAVSEGGIKGHAKRCQGKGQRSEAADSITVENSKKNIIELKREKRTWLEERGRRCALLLSLASVVHQTQQSHPAPQTEATRNKLTPTSPDPLLSPPTIASDEMIWRDEGNKGGDQAVPSDDEDEDGNVDYGVIMRAHPAHCTPSAHSTNVKKPRPAHPPLTTSNVAPTTRAPTPTPTSHMMIDLPLSPSPHLWRNAQMTCYDLNSTTDEELDDREGQVIGTEAQRVGTVGWNDGVLRGAEENLRLGWNDVKQGIELQTGWGIGNGVEELGGMGDEDYDLEQVVGLGC